MWKGEFGKKYFERNSQSVEELNSSYIKKYGVTRTVLNKEFLKGIPKDVKILEVGSNIGLQLMAIQKLGFNDLTGIEIFQEAIEKSKKITPGINTLKADAQDIPFKDNWFDLVFTSGVLIHIHPDNLSKVIDEICRVSKKFVWGFEYFSEKLQKINYRGNENRLWKTDFVKAYLERRPELELLKAKNVGYIEKEEINNVDSMFLFQKKAKPTKVEK